MIDRPEILEPRQCQKLGEEGVLNYHGRTWAGIKRNVPRTLTYYVHGKVNDNGSCTTAKLAVEGILFEVKVESVLGHVNAQGQLVTFSNGIRAPYDVGMAHDYMMAPSCGQWSRGSVMSQ